MTAADGDAEGLTVALVIGSSLDPQPDSMAVAASKNTADACRFMAS